MCPTINIWISFLWILKANNPKIVIWRPILEKIIDQFLLQRFQKKRYGWGYNIVEEFLRKWFGFKETLGLKKLGYFLAKYVNVSVNMEHIKDPIVEAYTDRVNIMNPKYFIAL